MLYMETDRLILRDYTKHDVEMYFKLKNDDKVMYYLQDIKLWSINEAEKDFENVLADMVSENRKYYFFHVELKTTHEQIGSVGYTVTDNTPVGKMVHLGYFSYPKYWNHGYVTEAVKRVLKFAFSENDVYRVTTGCLLENDGSEKVMKKCGLIKEAEHIDNEWFDGKMKTRVEYRMLKGESDAVLK